MAGARSQRASVWLGSLSKFSGVSAVATLMFGGPCGSPCSEDIQCRAFDVDAWCQSTHECQLPRSPGCEGDWCQASYFNEAPYPQTIWIWLPPIAAQLRALPLVLLQQRGAHTLPPLEVRLDGQPLSCEPFDGNAQFPNRRDGIRCPVAPDSLANPIDLQVIAPPTKVGYGVDISFSEHKCSKVVEVCGV